MKQQKLVHKAAPQAKDAVAEKADDQGGGKDKVNPTNHKDSGKKSTMPLMSTCNRFQELNSLDFDKYVEDMVLSHRAVKPKPPST